MPSFEKIAPFLTSPLVGVHLRQAAMFKDTGVGDCSVPMEANFGLLRLNHQIRRLLFGGAGPTSNCGPRCNAAPGLSPLRRRTFIGYQLPPIYSLHNAAACRPTS
jgi:hypothetical protein